MTSIYDEVKARGRCSNRRFRVDSIISEMGDDDKESLAAALADIDIPSGRIAHVLSERGWPISSNAIANYRRAKANV
jgi:hypothetical protein